MTQIFKFAVPLVFGTLFQQLYSFVDTVIVGRYLGESALAAVGSTTAVNWFILGFVQGACIGFGIPVAQEYGAKNSKELHTYLWNGVFLCIILSIVSIVCFVPLTATLLHLVNTPSTIFDMAHTYLLIIFLGIPFTVLYNYSASILRSLGNSKQPFYFLVASSILNIILDIVLIKLGWGVAGAATATIFSQFVSGVLCTYWLFKQTPTIEIHRDDIHFSIYHCKRLCIVGLPLGFEYSVAAIGSLLVQNAVNLLGDVAIAAQTTGEKIRQMFTLPIESLGMAMATYASQNYGAKKLERIYQGIKDGLLLVIGYCVLAWLIIFVGKQAFVYIVLGTTSGEVFTLSVEYLGIISTLFVIHGSLMIFRNTLQGIGQSMKAIISGVGEIIGRGFGAYLASVFGFFAICIAGPLAWGCALIYCIVMVTLELKKAKKLFEQE